VASEKVKNEATLRALVYAMALALYKKRWGKFMKADAAWLDVTQWRADWDVARKVEREAQRHLAGIGEALAFARELKAMRAGTPMGHAAQGLVRCIPALARTIKRKRANAIDVNAAEPAERSLWIHRRLRVYFRTDEELRTAPREELAALAILAGWWPPKATGLSATKDGMTPEHVLALEGELMHHARASIRRRRPSVERDPALTRAARPIKKTNA
jgi:hypothetical protein